MDTERRWPLRAAAFAAFGVVVAAACGARSQLDTPDAGDDASTGADAGPRACAPNCTIGHRCCQGSCDGPAVELPTDCCACIAGEVSSMECPGDVCGGGD